MRKTLNGKFDNAWLSTMFGGSVSTNSKAVSLIASKTAM